MVVDVKKLYSKLGSGLSIVAGGEIVEVYLLSEEEVAFIEKIANVLPELPEEFEFGFVEFENYKFGIFKLEGSYLVFPVKTENLGEIIRKKGVIRDDA
ncbi:MAG: hypothetical protein QXN34_07475 [Archaeoglobaceae archaeon]